MQTTIIGLYGFQHLECSCSLEVPETAAYIMLNFTLLAGAAYYQYLQPYS